MRLRLKRKEKKLSGNWAVLLIDMQTRFLQGFDEVRREKLVACQMSIVRCCADCDIPLVLVEFDDESTIETLTKAIEATYRHEKITKTTADAFSRPELLNCLRGWDINGVVLMGIYAAECVKETAKSALGNHLEIATSGELIADVVRLKIAKSGKLTSLTNNDSGVLDLRWYKRRGFYFSTSQELITALTNIK
ncbi:MAG: hypothetical protein CO161_01435 [Candidatus Portnoybacteria bacterium CG_4_9_14_3_um_filter_44_9]|uniref:Isochorismatase-like domain-containing protein n=2 Tax=Candidatus Portnoyibacteriota TaxID=1817913 RepID=A0A2M7YKC5_9BACT|nr:MAG: hypothetical protein CO161_01435 [Candidatus Portnoybacteria bacterium CG_4_9_14_3_um_filter_44_9]